MGKDTSMFSVSPLYEIKQVFIIIMTVTTIVLAAIAYAELKEISGDVIDVINNWKLIPYTDVYVANVGVDCASDYVEFSYKYGKFEGLARGHCGCRPNAHGYISTYPNCSDEASSSGACMTSNSRPSVDASTWRHQKVCFKREGQSAANWAEGYVRRPYPDEAGNCPTDYKKCGNGTDYENDLAICYPNEFACPITGVTIEPTSTTPTGSGWVKANGTFTREGHHLWYRRESIGDLPLNQITLTLTEYPSSDVGPDYDHSENNRGPCYTGTAQDIKADVAVSDTTLAAHTLSKPSKCKRVDRRYRLFDKSRLDSFYLDQFEDLSSCSGYDLYPIDDTNFDADTDADYLYSGNPCSGSDCDRDTSFPPTCNSNDDICDLVVNQNICGQYVSAVRDLKDDSNSIGVYYRSEIQWNPTCDVDQDSLRDNVDPLKRALDAQLAVVVISSIIGFFIGIVWPLCMLLCMKKKFYGKPNEITIPERIDAFLHIAKMIPLIVSVVVLSDIFRLYERAGEDDCSDSLTNESFDYLAERLPEIYFTNIANIIIECVMMLAGAYFLYSKMRAKMKVDVEATEEHGNNETPSSAAIPTVSTIAMQPTSVQPQPQPQQQMYQPVPQMQQQMQPQMMQPQMMQPQMQQQPVYQQQQQPVYQQQQQPVYQQQQQPVYQQQPGYQQQPTYQQQPQQWQNQPQMQQQQQMQPQQPAVMATIGGGASNVIPTVGVIPTVQ